MPRLSDCLQLLWNLDLMLIIALSHLRVRQLNSKAFCLSFSRHPVSSLLLVTVPAILKLLKVSSDLSVVTFLQWILSIRRRRFGRTMMWKWQISKLRTWKSTVSSILEGITLVHRRRYLAERIPRPRIASMGRSFEVMLQKNETFFRRWVSSLLKILSMVTHHWLGACFPEGTDDSA